MREHIIYVNTDNRWTKAKVIEGEEITLKTLKSTIFEREHGYTKTQAKRWGIKDE